jgi:hypothetical protein
MDLINSNKVKRKLTAILSADAKGYSRLMDQDEEATIRIYSFAVFVIID